MAKLKVFFHGQEIALLDLETGNQYIIGRGSNCNIQLPNEKGISRQHLKVFEQDSIWMIELLSKTGSLILDGENTSAIELSNDCRFSVPPFEFVFEFGELQESAAEGSATDEPAMEQTASRLENLSQEAEDIDNIDITSGGNTSEGSGLSDSTLAGVVNLVPMLRIKNEKTGEEYSLKLDGHIWTAGRTPDSEIHIPENAISRKHFEIALVGNSYSIKDLNSSNGTNLNGKSLTPNEIFEINSGDKISIRHISILFEVVDKNFEQKLAGIKELALVTPEVSQLNEMGMDVYQGPAVIKMESPEENGFLGNPKVKKALMIGAPILLVLAMFAGGGEPSDEGKKDGSSNAPETVTSPEDLAEAKHLLEVAKGHYISRNYSFCVTQLQKLHNIVPSYEDSKELEGFCQQAIELEQEQADRDAIERNKTEVQAKIQTIIDNCEASKTPTMTSAEMQICLQPALELSPEEPRAIALVSEIEIKETNEANAQQQQQARAARIRAGKNAYSAALRMEKQGKLKTAKKKYYSFIRGGYGLSNEESKARRSIASIDKRLDAQVMKSVTDCESFLNSGKYKDAIKNCKKALSIDSSNSKANAAIQKVNGKLRIEMKKIYSQSVLEENFGNIEAAKSQWKEIVEKSVPGEDYYKKAKDKLKKYGVE